MSEKEIKQELPNIVQTVVSNIIRDEKFNCRTNTSEKDVNEMVDSIKRQGVVNAPIVMAGKDGQYVLVAGFTRVAAIEKMGGKDAPINVRLMQFETSEDAQLVNALENFARKDLLPFDQARTIHRLHETIGLKQTRVAECLGISQSWVSQMTKLWMNLSPKVKEWWAGFKDASKQPDLQMLMAWSRKEKGEQNKALEAFMKDGTKDAKEEEGNGNGNGESEKGKKRTVKEIKAKLVSYAEKKEEGKITDEETIAFNVLRWVTGEVAKLSLKV